MHVFGITLIHNIHNIIYHTYFLCKWWTVYKVYLHLLLYHQLAADHTSVSLTMNRMKIIASSLICLPCRGVSKYQHIFRFLNALAANGTWQMLGSTDVGETETPSGILIILLPSRWQGSLPHLPLYIIHILLPIYIASVSQRLLQGKQLAQGLQCGFTWDLGRQSEMSLSLHLKLKYANCCTEVFQWVHRCSIFWILKYRKILLDGVLK